LLTHHKHRATIKVVAEFPKLPKHPERICWGCDKLCPADDMRCGNGTIRAPHPVELYGEDWFNVIDCVEAPEPATPISD